MNELSKIQKELERLGSFSVEDVPSPYWLANSYDAPVWDIDFNGVRQIKLDFRITLEDGSSLNSPKNQELLFTFKHWIYRSYEPSNSYSVSMRANSVYRRVSVTLKLIDYFLMRASEFQLSKYGLEMVTLNDLKFMLRTLSQSSHISYTLYQWPERLKSYMEEGCHLIDCDALLRDMPVLGDIAVAQSSFLLDATAEEVCRYRAFLWSEGYYRRKLNRNYGINAQLTLNTRALARRLLKNSLRGVYSHPKPPELDVGKHVRSAREHPPVNVKKMAIGKMNQRELWRYGRGLTDIIETETGLKGIFPRDIRNAVATLTSVAPDNGRFNTLPHRAVMYALRQAMEFYLKYSADLFNVYIAFCDECRSHKQKSKMVSFQAIPQSFLTGTLRDFDIKTWALLRGGPRGVRMWEDADAYNKEIRAGNGLWELLMVLFGAIHVTIAALSARRVSELVDRPVNRCLDQGETFLIFENRKSGSHETRQTELRPVPPIAVRMIKDIRHFQERLIQRGHLDNFRSVLAYPKQTKGCLVQDQSISNSSHLDMFCDFVEMPCDSKNHRYYIRSHQLRRFFAMAFLWSGTASGSDTLSHFLGHTDPEHLYRYISEDTRGGALVSVKAGLAAQILDENRELKDQIAALLVDRFSIKKFSILTEEELALYIEDLLEEGSVTVEPEFFEDAAGKRYQVCVRVLDKKVQC